MGPAGINAGGIIISREVAACFATPDDPGLAGKGELGNRLSASNALPLSYGPISGTDWIRTNNTLILK